LSGGQWQRVAIARAFLRSQQSQLLIFDEPTAAIDPNNEYEIYQVLRDMTQGRMSVIVSHRLGLVKIADRIIVMESGQIVEQGSHRESLLPTHKKILSLTEDFRLVIVDISNPTSF
jgi:ATP-binding cassette, subfamily B, bacterial